ncbi:MAG: hypothetical protein QOF86_2143 [Baekduia sp.]|jgi:hypothetical protein|nr:hypothetical protein [Baekduia sp.]
MKKLIALGVATMAATLAPAAIAAADNAKPFERGVGQPTTLAVYGDSPYGTSPADTSEFLATPAFVDSINADPDVSLVMQVGDIHSGKQYCTEAYDQSIFDQWKRFADPLVYTPGDNEWADCHKAAEGGGTYNAATQQVDFKKDASGNLIDYAGGNPVANLALVRRIFFPQPGMTLGGDPQRVLSQAEVADPRHPGDRQFVENVMWSQSRVLFVTVNVPGGSNNETDPWYGAPTASAEQTQEAAARTGATVRWLKLAFDTARELNMRGVVVGAQADMWDMESGAAHQAAYAPIVDALASGTTAFGKPVLMFNGDSHVYKSDNPLSASDPLNVAHPGYDVPNFHRVVVHGSTFPLEWLKLTVDTKAQNPAGDTAFGPFSWEREIQP